MKLLREYKEIPRGDHFEGQGIQVIVPSDPDFDFTGFKVAMQLKRSADELGVVYDFAPIPDVSTPGQMIIPVYMPVSVTQNLEARKYFTDVEIWRENPSFPNLTIGYMTFEIEKDISQPRR
jgi:hypothetical protein